jgi:hypothetical protein
MQINNLREFGLIQKVKEKFYFSLRHGSDDE